MAPRPTKPRKRTPPRRQHASEEAREGIERLSRYIDFIKSLGVMLGMIAAVFVGFWNIVGKPYAQSFVNETVDGRVGALEEQAAALAKSQRELIAQTGILASQITVLQSTAEGSQQTQSEILRILRNGLAPAPSSTTVQPPPVVVVPDATTTQP